ncbi:MAG: tripartite tricarboxylate transporter permease [Alphaproteobacteria bacterium]|nr:tripartite tricarboxylate transporter permease [Alphaproteobacteria bacterium]
MELIGNLALGFGVALSPMTLLYCLIGVTAGTLIGVLPGIGPIATVGMLLPITFHLPPVQAIIMLAGIYYGAMYGGSTTAILLKLPGTAASAVACIEGYPMAQQGRAGPALVMTTLASFFGACVAIIIVGAFAPPLAQFALEFGSPEFFSLMLVGLIAAAVLAHGSLLKGLAMAVLGLILGMVGQDVSTGFPRFTFGLGELYEGVKFVIVVVGLFGLAEIVHNIGLGDKREIYAKKVPLRELIPLRRDLRVSFWPMVRGTGIGAVIGILPGAGPAISAFASYAVEKRIAKDPSEFGKGSMAGLVAPEAANNSTAQTAFIPTLTLGVPGDATTAIILGAMLIHGIVPGPKIVTEAPELFWGLIASFWIGNLMLLVLNLPFIGLWVRLLSIPYQILFPSILLFVCIGVFSLNNEPADVIMAAAFGIIGYVFLKLGCEAAPLLLGLILGPMVEENLRRSLQLSRGDPMIFLTRPISLTFLIAGVFLILLVVVPALRKPRKDPTIAAGSKES